MVALEKAGKPTAGIVSAGFEGDAKATARAFGLTQYRYALVPKVLTGLSPEQIESDVTDALDQFVSVLTTDAEAVAQEIPRSKPTEHIRVEASDGYDAYLKMNEQFLEQQWGDGFPVIAPTPQAVERMLKGTKRDPDDVVTVLTPGNGLATVEKIAINAVMAGCQPSHLPILIAACEAYTGLGDRVRAMAMSTSTHAPLLVINGPIAKELGINSKRCAMGPGLQSRHNIAIGRALRLIMINVGNCRPGHMDMDTIGTARKFGMCVAENEEENPWEPLHVEKGYKKEDSTVTIYATRDEIDVNDLYSWTPEGVLNSLSYFSAIPGGEYLQYRYPGASQDYAHMLMMSPAHANICGKAGWSKKSVREYVYQQCRTTAWRLMSRYRNVPDKLAPQWKWLLKLSEREMDEIMLPVMENANFIEIVVVGGPSGKNLIYRCLTNSSTALIRDRA